MEPCFCLRALPRRKASLQNRGACGVYCRWMSVTRWSRRINLLAEQYVPSGTAALLVASDACFLTIFAWITRLTARPSRTALFALLLGIAGVFILSRPDFASALSSNGQSNWYLGVTVLLISSSIWAAGSLYSKNAARPSSAILGVGTK